MLVIMVVVMVVCFLTDKFVGPSFNLRDQIAVFFFIIIFAIKSITKKFKF